MRRPGLLRRHALLVLGIDADDMRRISPPEQRQRIEHRARGLAAAIPADDDAVEIETCSPPARQDQHRAAGADQHALDAVELDARDLGGIGGAQR